MPHQTIQLLAVHAPQGVQGEVRGDRNVVGAVDGLAGQLGVPGQAGRRAGHRATGSGLPVALSLHQNHRVHGGDRNGWRGIVTMFNQSEDNDDKSTDLSVSVKFSQSFAQTVTLILAYLVTHSLFNAIDSYLLLNYFI